MLFLFSFFFFSQKEEGKQLLLELQPSEGHPLNVHLKVGNQATNQPAVEEVYKIILFVFLVMVNLLFCVCIMLMNAGWGVEIGAEVGFLPLLSNP